MVGGLREQNKSRTRERLVGVAVSLFEERGFHEVTVEEIADAALASPRTFYRYFGSKEGVLYDDDDDSLATLRHAITTHDAERPPVEAVQAAVLALARRSAGRQDMTRRRLRLIEATASVGAFQRTHLQPRWEQALADAIAERLGVDVDTDVRPRLLAGVGIVVMTSMTQSFSAGPGPVDLEALVLARFADLRGLVAGQDPVRVVVTGPTARTGTA